MRAAGFWTIALLTGSGITSTTLAKQQFHQPQQTPAPPLVNAPAPLAISDIAFPQLIVPSGQVWTSLKPFSPPPSGGPYGEQRVYRPLTTAELAGQPRGGRSTVQSPNNQPTTATIKEPPRYESPVPRTVDTSTTVAKPIMPSTAPTPVAQRAFELLTSPHPVAVREQICESLQANDLQSSTDLVAALAAVARGNDAEVVRKAAIRTLVRSRMHVPDVTAMLDKLTEDPAPGVRVEAAIGLARIKVQQAK